LYKSDKEKFEDCFRMTIGGHEMELEQEYAWASVDTVGLTVWDASLVLAAYLEQLQMAKGKELFAGRRVLELGSGCGVAGIAAALLGARVVLTDWEVCIPLLRRNAARNAPLCAHPVEVQLLSWRLEEEAGCGCEPYEIVLGADLLYQSHAILPLLRTLHRLTNPSSLILFSYERHNEMPDEFLRQVPEYFDLEEVPMQGHHPLYRHPRIVLLRLRRRSGPLASPPLL
jgi:predicted nicotinamide N-methyase